jgi:hypothetical protein
MIINDDIHHQLCYTDTSYTLLSSAIRNIDLYHYASLDIYMILAGAVDS